MIKQLFVLLTIAFALTSADTIQTENHPLYAPEQVGMRSSTLNRIDRIVKLGMHARAFPGCQIFVMKDGKPVYDRCFGSLVYESNEKVTSNTLYDLASLSKTTGTLLAIMKLYDEGKLLLTDTASKFLPFLRGTDKENITITNLLFHESGFPASLDCYRLVIEKKDSINDSLQTVRMNSTTHRYKTGWVSNIQTDFYNSQISNSLYIASCFHDSAMALIAHTRLRNKTYLYSCINFILLKEIAETITNIPMDIFLDSVFYKPMGLKNMTYKPLLTHPNETIAPTLKRDFLRSGVIQGHVHDPDAAFLGGVSGNAGLFASASDVAKVYQMLLNDGDLDGKRYLRTETCKTFTSTTSSSGRRGLGFDKPIPGKPGHSPCCVSAPTEVYGHTGYTGTCCWVDPINKLVYVFLSNRTYPNDGINKLARMGIRTDIQEVIYQSIK
ncbi:MAG TPA: serine hydrolase [Bacteroidales bacterium]|nr:serine hydrolase [Bacteroidales bacterium]